MCKVFFFDTKPIYVNVDAWFDNIVALIWSTSKSYLEVRSVLQISVKWETKCQIYLLFLKKIVFDLQILLTIFVLSARYLKLNISFLSVNRTHVTWEIDVHLVKYKKYNLSHL